MLLHHILLLQVSHKHFSDSTFQSLDRVGLDSLLSLNNPVLFSIVVLSMMLFVMYIFQRYIIIPMRKRHLEAEENLRLQKAELMAIFAEYSPDPILRFDTKGKVVLANNEATRLFNIPASNGTKVTSLIQETNKLNWQEIITNASSIEFASKIGNKYYRFIINGIPKFSIGQIYGRDVTHLIEKEKELEGSLRTSEEATRIKQEFLARISHAIRSPLVAIQGYAELLAEEFPDNLDEEYKIMFFSMSNASKKLYRTIDLVLNISQLHSGRYECRPEKIFLNKALRKIYKEFKTVSTEKELEFNVHYETDETLTLNYDKHALEQIFKQLVDNSFRFTLEGKISITAYEKNGSVCVDISDTGIGFSQEHLEKLLEPMSRENLGYLRKHEGTGFGLALVKSYLNLHDTGIKINSKQGEGTTVTLILDKN